MKRAIGMLLLQVFSRTPGLENTTPQEVVEHFLAIEETGFPVATWQWYVTLRVARTVDLDESSLMAHRYYWIDPSMIQVVERELEEAADPALERLSATIASVVGEGYLSNVVLTGTFFHAPDRISFGDPKTQLSATLSVGRNLEAFPGDILRKRLAALKSAVQGDDRALASARHWYLAAIVEKDPWKKFTWAFLALEILTHKLGRRYYTAVVKQLDYVEPQARSALLLGEVVTELVPDPNRLTLVAEFAVMALALSHQSALEDVTKFKELKGIRDRLAHGDLKRSEELQVDDATRLLQKFFAIAMERHG